MDSGPHRIAVIDDDRGLVQTIRVLLEAKGYSVSCAYGGKDGLELVKRDIPDLVLLDINMPDLDGRDVLIRMKKENSTKDIPVIFLTGRGEQYERSYGIELGAYEYISKPYDGVILLRQIENILSKKK